MGAYGWLNLMEFTVCCQPHATRWCTINATKLTVELRTREERRLIRAQVIVACGLLPHVTAREEVVSSIAVVHGQDGGQKVRVGHDAEGTHWLSPTASLHHSSVVPAARHPQLPQTSIQSDSPSHIEMPPRKKAKASAASTPLGDGQPGTPQATNALSQDELLNDPWEDEQEIQLLKSMMKWKPTGKSHLRWCCSCH